MAAANDEMCPEILQEHQQALLQLLLKIINGDGDARTLCMFAGLEITAPEIASLNEWCSFVRTYASSRQTHGEFMAIIKTYAEKYVEQIPTFLEANPIRALVRAILIGSKRAAKKDDAMKAIVLSGAGVSERQKLMFATGTYCRIFKNNLETARAFVAIALSVLTFNQCGNVHYHSEGVYLEAVYAFDETVIPLLLLLSENPAKDVADFWGFVDKLIPNIDDEDAFNHAIGELFKRRINMHLPHQTRAIIDQNGLRALFVSKKKAIGTLTAIGIENPYCTVCFESGEGGHRTLVTMVFGMCGHVLCAKCVGDERLQSCPMCRSIDKKPAVMVRACVHPSCKLPFSADVRPVVTPCGHLGLCEGCSGEATPCPEPGCTTRSTVGSNPLRGEGEEDEEDDAMAPSVDAQVSTVGGINTSDPSTGACPNDGHCSNHHCTMYHIAQTHSVRHTDSIDGISDDEPAAAPGRPVIPPLQLPGQTGAQVFNTTNNRIRTCNHNGRCWNRTCKFYHSEQTAPVARNMRTWW